MKGTAICLVVCLLSAASLLTRCHDNNTKIQDRSHIRYRRFPPEEESYRDYDLPINCVINIPGHHGVSVQECETRMVENYKLLLPCKPHDCDIKKLIDYPHDYNTKIYISSMYDYHQDPSWIFFEQKLSTVKLENGNYVWSYIPRTAGLTYDGDVHSGCSHYHKQDEGVMCQFMGYPQEVYFWIVKLSNQLPTHQDPPKGVTINQMVLSSGDEKYQYSFLLNEKVPVLEKGQFWNWPDPGTSKRLIAKNHPLWSTMRMFNKPCLRLAYASEPNHWYEAGCVHNNKPYDPKLFFESEACTKNGGAVKVQFCANFDYPTLCSATNFKTICEDWNPDGHQIYKDFIEYRNISPEKKTTTTKKTTTEKTTTKKKTTTKQKTTPTKTTTKKPPTTIKATMKVTSKSKINNIGKTTKSTQSKTTVKETTGNKATDDGQIINTTTDQSGISNVDAPTGETAHNDDNKNGKDGNEQKGGIEGNKNEQKETNENEKNTNENGEDGNKTGGNTNENYGKSNETESKNTGLDQAEETGDKKGSNTTVFIVAGIIGFLILLIVAVLLLLFFVRRRRPKEETDELSAITPKTDKHTYSHETSPHGVTEPTNTYANGNGKGYTEDTGTYVNMDNPNTKKQKRARGLSPAQAMSHEQSVKMSPTATPMERW